MDVGMELTRMILANYPEGVRRVFVVNGNWIASENLSVAIRENRICLSSL